MIGNLKSKICNSTEATMLLAKITCPKCKATLKPAKPVPEGKTVKCPKCEETFKAGGKSAEDDAPAKKPAPAQEEAETYGIIKDDAEEKKKAEAEERRRRKKKRKRADEDSDEDEDEEDDEDEEKEDVTAQYLKNLKPSDPRGAAQETVVGPANWLLRTALLGFFGWVFYFGALMLPIAFPHIENKDENAAAAPQEKDKAKEKKQAVHWWSADTILNEENMPWSVVLFVLALLAGLAQAGVIANASVKMQGLESYNWSLWGCILAMIPLVTFPWVVFITYILDLFDWLITLDFGETCWMVGLAALAWGPLVGGLCLKQFLQPQVKPGFEYKPD
jgi:hypothetical protein